MYVLGVHRGHDASASLIKDGKIIAAVNEERFVRVKHYAEWPLKSIEFCLNYEGIDFEDIDIIAVPASSNPNIDAFFGIEKHTSAQYLYDFFSSESRIPRVLKPFGNIAKRLIGHFGEISTFQSPPLYMELFKAAPGTEVVYVDHHTAHAASAYYTSGFNEKALIVTVDGVGAGTSTAVWSGENGKLKRNMKIGTEGSLGWAYGQVTEALGWWVGNGEGTTMGLAPYGDVNKAKGALDNFFPWYKNGYLQTAHDFGLVTGLLQRGTYHWHFKEALQIKKLVDTLGRENIAAEAQRLLEEQLLDIVLSWSRRLQVKKIAVAGGVFLNVKANQRIIESGEVEEYHVYPDAGDGGLAEGAALYAYYEHSNDSNIHRISNDKFGPDFDDSKIEKELKIRNLAYTKHNNIDNVSAELLANGKIIGWFQGRMEKGPRALGSRSILMDPRREENKDIINARVKYREPFRPFCPSILAEAAEHYFKGSREAPYMIISFDAIQEKIPEIAATVHVDGTSRPQTVDKRQGIYCSLIRAFGELTGVPVVLNTSFNIKGEPVVCTPSDAIRCFFDTGMDYMAIGSFLVKK